MPRPCAIVAVGVVVSDKPTRPLRAAPVDFSSNDHIFPPPSSPLLRLRIFATLNAAPSILGSGGLRLLVYNHTHVALQVRLARTFHVPTASFQLGLLRQRELFLVNSAAGRHALYDAAIHTSVDDGVRVSRVAARLHHPFVHSDVRALHDALRAPKDCENSAAAENVCSMGDTIVLLHAILDITEGSCAPSSLHSARPSPPPMVCALPNYGMSDEALHYLHNLLHEPHHVSPCARCCAFSYLQ